MSTETACILPRTLWTAKMFFSTKIDQGSKAGRGSAPRKARLEARGPDPASRRRAGGLNLRPRVEGKLLPARSALGVPEPALLQVEFIIVSKRHRLIDKKALARLIDSIRAVGLQNPIAVRRLDDGRAKLVTGAYRLAAYEALGFMKIPARILPPETATIWSVSENLHRVELSRLERSLAIDKYAKRRAMQLKMEPEAQPGGAQPHDEGNSKIARELKMDRKMIRAARSHARISREAQELLKTHGMDNRRGVLDKVASLTRREQIAAIKKIAARQNRSRIKPDEAIGMVAAAKLSKLKAAWEKLEFRNEREKAVVAKSFIADVLRPRPK